MGITTGGVENRNGAKNSKMTGVSCRLRRVGYGDTLLFPEGDENA
jgi:hypothetical protein